jgi:hypothetical protein
MKLIPLTKGFFTQVDDVDFEELKKYKWHAKRDRRNIYACRISLRSEGHKTIRMHRQILNCTQKQEGDHIDHNGLNNQRGNLRIATHSQNLQNNTGRGSSKFLGVSREQTGNYVRFRALIQHNKISICVGSFKTEIEAAKAYDKKAIELHGEFANLNFKP